MNTPAVSYKNHRFPPDIIAHAVWLYYRFPLSLRLVEEMLLERGIVVSYETIRRWGRKFGPDEFVLRRPRCLIPSFDGASLSSESKDALWARFFMGAPRRQRQSVDALVRGCRTAVNHENADLVISMS